MSDLPISLALSVPDDLLDRIASAVAVRLADHSRPEPTSPFATVEEAATYLRCNRQRIYDLTSSRKLPVFKDGKRNLYRYDDLAAVLQERK